MLWVSVFGILALLRVTCADKNEVTLLFPLFRLAPDDGASCPDARGCNGARGERPPTQCGAHRSSPARVQNSQVRTIALLQTARTVKRHKEFHNKRWEADENGMTGNTTVLQNLVKHKTPTLTTEVHFLEEGQNSLQAPISSSNHFHFDTVSVAMFCVIWLNITLLMAYTLLSLLRNSAELSQANRPVNITEGLTIAVRSNSHAAALGTLFVGCRMYLLEATDGTRKHEQGMKALMIVATAGLMLQIFLALLLPHIMNIEDESKSISELAGESTDCHPRLSQDAFKSHPWWICACSVQAGAMTCLYGGAGGIVSCIFMFEASTHDSSAHMSSAIICVFLLDAIFLLNQLHLFFKRCAGGLVGGVRIASLRARKAPMIAVLFLAARIRDLQLSPPQGGRSPWARLSSYVVVAAMTTEVVCSVIAGTPAMSNGEEEKIREAYHPEHTHPWVRRLQQLSAFMIFEGLILVSFSIFVTGPSAPLSSTLSCVLLLSLLFFMVHVFQFLASFATQLSKWGEIMRSTALSAGVCVSLCPMLSILFVACRMRALQLTSQQGSPQWWTENAMELCTFAIFIQVLCCMALPAFTGAATVVDPDGNAKFELPPMTVAYAVQAIKYIALLCLYGGLLTVCLGIFRMHPRMNDAKKEYHKELLSQIAIAIGIIFAASLLSSAKVIGLVVKWAIESIDESFLGVKMTVDKAALSFLHGYICINDLVVKNPQKPKFSSQALLKVDKVLIKIKMWRMLRSRFSEIEISTLVLDGIDVNYEVDVFGNSNIQTVVSCMAGGEGVAELQDCQGDQIQLIFKGLFQIQDIRTNIWNMRMGKLVTLGLGDVIDGGLHERFTGKVFAVVRGLVMMVMKKVLNTVLANARNLVKYAPSKCCPCCGCLAMCRLCQ